MPKRGGFELPEINSKTVTKSTRNLYKSYLNQLAKQGWKSIPDLIANDAAVVKYIEEALVNEPNQKFRIYYSAIFYALADSEYVKSPNAYYRAFQLHKDAIPQKTEV
jgi:hypothetical protein